MFLAYIDESKTAEKHPVVAVGGGIGSGLQWKNALRGWKAALDTEPSVEVFHSNEFETPEGRIGTCYEQWGDSRRKQFNGALTDALVQNQIGLAITVSVRPEEFEAVKTRRSKRLHYGPSFNAHYMCAVLLVEQTAVWATKNFPKHLITYYFEEGGPHQIGFKKAYAQVANDPDAKELFRLWKNPDFVSKDRHPGLQIADKLIYEGAKFISHEFDQDPNPKHSVLDIETGLRRWKPRYSTARLFNAGLEMQHIWLREQEIEEFFDDEEEDADEQRS